MKFKNYIFILSIFSMKVFAGEIDVDLTKIQGLNNIADVEKLKKELDAMKKNAPIQTPTKGIVTVENKIDKNLTTGIAINDQVADNMKKNIFNYQTDGELVQERNSFYLPTNSNNSSRFGDQFFLNKNNLNGNTLPIPANYQINKGDLISVWLYGGRNKSEKLEVDRNGNINIEGIGPTYVYNIEFGKLKEFLADKYESIYKNIKINIDLDRTTPIQISIAGEVNAPGLYNLPAFATIKEALSISEGISQFGSYRNIKLMREGAIVREFDIYKLMQKGDSALSTAILKNGDSLIVARTKKNIFLSGEIKRSGSYELKEGEYLNNLLNFAGGLKAGASNTIAKLERLDNNKKRVVFDIDLSKNINLFDGDKITIMPINIKNSESVYLYGNIVRNGERGYKNGITLYSLFQWEIKMNGINNLLLKNSELDYAVIKRYNFKKFEDEIITFSLQDILSGKKDINLEKSDEIYIFNRAELKENPYIYLTGKVLSSPGKYQYFKNMKLKDIRSFTKFKSENLNSGERQYLQVSDDIKIVRNVSNNAEILFFNIWRDENVTIQQFDEITFFDKLEREVPQKAFIRGEVLNNGNYLIDNSTDINKLIKLAGGLTKSAYYKNFEVIRYRVENGERKYQIIKMALSEAIKTNFKIEEFDEVTIFRIPNWNDQETVLISGEVKFPGRYIVQRGDTLQDLITRAGGYLSTAFLDGAIFTRKSIQQQQEQRLKESIRKLKQDTTYLLSIPSVSDGENSSSEKMMLVKMLDSLVMELTDFKPNGRISVNLKDSNFSLENGDELYIPTVNESVAVIGEVLNPTTFFYFKGSSVSDYLDKAGGLSHKADEDNIYIVHANGEAETYNSSWLFGNSKEIKTGDTIIVPIKIYTSSYLAFSKDISQIIYQLAVTAVSLKTIGILK